MGRMGTGCDARSGRKHEAAAAAGRPGVQCSLLARHLPGRTVVDGSEASSASEATESMK